MPETEEECVELYQDRIYLSQNRQLYPLQEDLADWINKTLGKLIKIIFLMFRTKLLVCRPVHMTEIFPISSESVTVLLVLRAVILIFHY